MTDTTKTTATAAAANAVNTARTNAADTARTDAAANAVNTAVVIAVNTAVIDGMNSVADAVTDLTSAEVPTTASNRPIRTFHPRRGRMSARHTDAHSALWPAYGISVVDGDRTPLDLAVLFGRSAPVVVEIGFGMGDSLAAMAAVDPGRDYLGVEVHTPGIGNLFALVGEAGLTNVRVAHGDAIELIQRIGLGALDAVQVFFPDPWPKARHHKRRLIQPANVALLAARLRPGGLLHCATDWPDYAAAMVATLDAAPNLIKASAAAQPKPTTPKLVPGERTQPATTTDGEPTRPVPAAVGAVGRPVTKFERRGVQAGRPITDLRYLRR